jgi:hypothetical protein
VGFFIPIFVLKYHRLNEEQFYEMHQEFAVYLASNGIDKTKWDEIKQSNSSQVTELLDGFSDQVWDSIIKQCNYLEFVAQNQLFLFKTDEKLVTALVIKVSDIQCDLATKVGFQWMIDHIHSDAVTLSGASKSYHPDRSTFIYSYILKGAFPTNGKRYEGIKSYFSNSTK